MHMLVCMYVHLCLHAQVCVQFVYIYEPDQFF